MSAGTTGNNLLYLLYSALTATAAVSALAGWWNLRGLEASIQAPGQVFRGSQFPLRLTFRKKAGWSCFAVEAVLGSSRAALGTLSAGAKAVVELRACASHRGWNLIEGLAVESLFPWGLIRHRRALPGIEVLAYPCLREVHSIPEIRAEARASGRPTLRKGTGDELYGVRAYDPSDDVRMINWKLSARAGRPLVNEHCETRDSRITVTVAGGGGPEAERRIEDAGSACRYYIDSGAEVRLVSTESEVDYGKGLLQLDRLLVALSLLGEGKTARSCLREAWADALGLPDGIALRRLLFGGACLVYAAVYLIDDVNARFWTLLLPLLPLGWFLQESRRSLIPRIVWDAMTATVLFYTVGFDWRFNGVIVAVTHIQMYLLANRFLTPFQRAELGQTFLIFLLTFFCVSGLTISPWYFAYFITYAAFCGASLWLACGAGIMRTWRAWTPALCAWMAAVLVLCVFCFALTPRVEHYRRMSPLLAALNKLQAKSSSVTGFTENVSLGWFGELKRSSARVMRVKPLGISSGTPGVLRVRGAAYDIFDGQRWKKENLDFNFLRAGRFATSIGGRGWMARRNGELRLPVLPPTMSAPSYEFAILPMGLSVLFTVGTPWFIETIDGVDAAAYFDYTDSLYVATPNVAGARYRAYSAGPAGALTQIAEMDDALRRRYLTLPPDPSGEIARLAAIAVQGAVTEEAKARGVQDYLRRHYSYSMYSESRGVSLQNFLFNGKRGNCEYFASAGVVLMREAGIPARLVTGFLSDDWNEYGGFYDIRQRNAHAWVEAYVAGRGWTTFDPTPPESAFSVSADALSRRMERWLDAFQGEWYRSVIGYDQYTQSNTFHKIGVKLTLDDLVSALKSIMSLVVGGWALWGIGALVAQLKSRWEEGQRLGPYGRAELMLARAGLSRPAHLTPREYAAWVASRRPDLMGLGGLAELHYCECYAGRAPSEPERMEARRILAELSARL
jgi:uncharacterized protein (DUF58 family)